MIRFHEPDSTASRLDAMAERTLGAEVIRLQRLNSDEAVRQSLDEASRLLSEARYSEAEALLENAAARVRQQPAA